MEELVLHNVVDVNTGVMTQQGGAGYSNSGAFVILGGLFTVTTAFTLTYAGIPNVAQFQSSQMTDLGSSVFNSGGTVQPGNAGYVTFYGSALYGNSVVSLSGGTPTSTLGSGNSISTVIPNLGFFDTTTPPTANITEDCAVFGSTNQYMQIWQMTPTVTKLASFQVTPAAQLTHLSPTISLQPEITYAVSAVGGFHSMPYTNGRSVSSYSNEYIVFGSGFDSTTGLLVGAGGTSLGLCSQSGYVITATKTVSLNPGDIITGPTISTQKVISSSISGGHTTITTNLSTSYTNRNGYAYEPVDLDNMFTSSVMALRGTAGAPTWYGDFYLEGIAHVDDQITVPPPPLVSSTTAGQFTITLPQALLPSDLLEFDLQYAKGVDDVAYGNWLDIGTFPAVQTQDASDSSSINITGVYTHQAPDTTPPLPYYIYRYRLRTSNYSESLWSSPGFAGQVQSA